jgi:hypothetical protein
MPFHLYQKENHIHKVKMSKSYELQVFEQPLMIL